MVYLDPLDRCPIILISYNAILKLCFVILQVVCLFTVSSCAPYRCSTQQIAMDHFTLQESSKPVSKELVNKSANHWLYCIVPLHSKQIYWFDLGHWFMWSIFGNEDDGLFGEGPDANYCPNSPIATTKALRWFIRNPFHNLFFYVIGRKSQQPVKRYSLLELTDHGLGIFCGLSSRSYTFIGHKFGFQFCLHRGLPLLSFRSYWGLARKSEFYVGWRDQVNFGLKLRLFSKTSEKEKVRLRHYEQAHHDD